MEPLSVDEIISSESRRLCLIKTIDVICEKYIQLAEENPFDEEIDLVTFTQAEETYISKKEIDGKLLEPAQQNFIYTTFSQYVHNGSGNLFSGQTEQLKSSESDYDSDSSAESVKSGFVESSDESENESPSNSLVPFNRNTKQLDNFYENHLFTPFSLNFEEYSFQSLRDSLRICSQYWLKFFISTSTNELVRSSLNCNEFVTSARRLRRNANRHNNFMCNFSFDENYNRSMVPLQFPLMSGKIHVVGSDRRTQYCSDYDMLNSYTNVKKNKNSSRIYYKKILSTKESKSKSISPKSSLSSIVPIESHSSKPKPSNDDDLDVIFNIPLQVLPREPIRQTRRKSYFI